MKKRFRIFDFRCPLFWIVLFYQKNYGEPAISLEIFRETYGKGKWWFYWLIWEDVPNYLGQADIKFIELV